MPSIQLKANWAGYGPGAIVTVSNERAEYLVSELGLARLLEAQEPEPDNGKPKKKEPRKKA